MNSAVLRSRALAENQEQARQLADNPPVSEPAANRELAYPSLVAHIKIVFDETLQVVDDTGTDGIADPFADFTAGRVKPLLTTVGAANRSFIRHIVPLSCDVELPETRKAGTFTLKILFDEFPLDPRPVAAIGVEIHVGTVSAEDFARGMTGAWSSGERPSVLNRFNPDTLRLVGTADECETDFPRKGPAVVTISGRDMRGILLDAEFPTRRYRELDLTRPIDELVRQILHMDKLGAEFAASVDIQPQEWPNGKVPSVDGDGEVVGRLHRGPSGTKPHIPAPSENPNYWDLITHYCTLVGAVPFFRGASLRIRPGRSIHDERAKGLFDPVLDLPFRNRAGDPAVRHDVNGNPLRVRQYIYGNNVGSVKFKKKFNGVKVPVVRVVGLDTNSSKRGAERQFTAEWPPVGSLARKNKQSSTGASSEEEPMNVKVDGIQSNERALEVAKDLYNEIGRQEIGGDYEAVNLSSLGGDGADPDNLRLNTGDAVEIYAATAGFGARSALLATITDNRAASFGEAVKAVTDAMERAGNRVDDNLARVLVATARGAIAKMLSIFRVTSVKLNWDGQGKRISVGFSFDNFLLSRNAVTPSNGAVTKEPVKTAMGKKRATTKQPGSGRRLPSGSRSTPASVSQGEDGFGGDPMDSTPSSRGEVRDRITGRRPPR